jgi:hypothetical protein
MCMFSAPKVPTPPTPAQFQPMLQPVQLPGQQRPKRSLRGLYSSIFTSPEGANGMPRVTGTMGGMTGG